MLDLKYQHSEVMLGFEILHRMILYIALILESNLVLQC